MIRYLVEVLLAERQPALLEVDDSGRLLSSGGSLVHHGPVSYTHLDVYKRQGQETGARKSEEEGNT